MNGGGLNFVITPSDRDNDYQYQHGYYHNKPGAAAQPLF